MAVGLLVTIGFPFGGEFAISSPITYRRLAVLEFLGKAVDTDVLEAFSDAVRGGAVDDLVGRDINVMTRENMMVLLREMGKWECTMGDCQVETARNIGADFVISGSVVRIEDSYVVVLKLHDVHRATLLAAENVQAKTQLAALNQLRQLGKELAAKITVGPQTATPAPEVTPTPEPPAALPSLKPPPLAVQPPTVEATDVPASEPASPGSRLRAIGIMSGVVGLAAVGAGIGFGAGSASIRDQITSDAKKGSYDRAKDDRGRLYSDLQWIGYGVGAVAVAGGAFFYYLGYQPAAATQPQTTLKVLPVLSPGKAGVALQGAF